MSKEQVEPVESAEDNAAVENTANQATEEQPETTATSTSEELTVEELSELLLAAQTKAEEHREQLLRARADVDNIQRRAERDVANAHKFALEKFSNELLPVLDSLERALDSESTDETAAMREGIELTLKMFTSALEKFGITALNPQGESFNPEHHEAMSMQENPDVEPNTVIAVFQKGYLLNDRLIRPARVVVSRGPAKPIDTTA